MQITTEIIVSILVFSGISFLIVRFLCRYQAKNFLAAKVALGVFFLGGFATLINDMQAGHGIQWHNIESLFLAFGAVLGYFSGMRKYSGRRDS